MSLPFYSLNCTSCGFGRRFCFDTAYQFAGSNNDYAPLLQTAWCDDCDRVVISSAPQTEASIADDVALRTEWIAAEKSRKRNIFHPLRKPDESIIEAWEAEIAHLKMGVAFFRDQKITPRCLCCGGRNVTPVTLPDAKAGAGAIGVRHHCGGEIQAVIEGRINFGALPQVTYNLDGQILSDERDAAAAETLDEKGARAVTGLAGCVAQSLLEAARLPDQIESIAHPEFSILGVYLSVREFLAVTERGGDVIATSLHVLSCPPFLGAEGGVRASDSLKRFAFDALQKYDREANCRFGQAPALWSTFDEATAFGQAACKILLDRLDAYPGVGADALGTSVADLEGAIMKQTEILTTAFNELLETGQV